MGQAVQLLLLGALLRYVHAHTHHAQGLAIGTGADDFAQAAYPAWWCVGWLRNAQRDVKRLVRMVSVDSQCSFDACLVFG